MGYKHRRVQAIQKITQRPLEFTRGHFYLGLTAGIPFFQGTLLGDFFYTATLFGAYELVLKWRERKELLPASLV